MEIAEIAVRRFEAGSTYYASGVNVVKSCTVYLHNDGVWRWFAGFPPPNPDGETTAHFATEAEAHQMLKTVGLSVAA
jgi:hypothetical protein